MLPAPPPPPRSRVQSACPIDLYLLRIPVNKGTNAGLGWTKYSNLYEIVHPSIALTSLCLHTGAECKKGLLNFKMVRVNIPLRACLHGGGGPQIGEVICGGSPHLSCQRDQLKMRDYVDRWVIPPKRVTSPNWGSPPPCKQGPSLVPR